MTNGDPYEYLKVGTACGTTTSTYYYDESSPNMDDWRYIGGSSVTRIIEKGGEDMRYLYEVILVNPKDDEFEIGIH